MTESAARVLRKEITAAQRAAVKFAADTQAWATWVDSFYADHHLLVMSTMLLDEPTALSYVAIQRDELRAGLSAIEAWTPDYLVGLALDKPKHDPMPDLLKAAIERPSPDVHVPVTIAKGAMEVHPAAVHSHAAAVTVSAPHVTIEAGAIQHTTQIAAAEPHAFTVDKKVTRTKDGISGVTETHTPVTPKRATKD